VRDDNEELDRSKVCFAKGRGGVDRRVDNVVCVAFRYGYW
jgi:hypothetical protein